MANAASHRLGAMIAVGAGLLVSDREDQKRSLKPLAGGGVAYVCGTLPDILEPAGHPNHRQIFHSWAAVALAGYGIYRAYKWRPDTEGQKWCRLVLIAIGGAYLTHLLMDAGTPKGLPWV